MAEASLLSICIFVTFETRPVLLRENSQKCPNLWFAKSLSLGVIRNQWDLDTLNIVAHSFPSFAGWELLSCMHFLVDILLVSIVGCSFLILSPDTREKGKSLFICCVSLVGLYISITSVLKRRSWEQQNQQDYLQSHVMPPSCFPPLFPSVFKYISH